MRDSVCDFVWYCLESDTHQGLTEQRSRTGTNCFPHEEILTFWPKGSVPIISDLFKHRLNTVYLDCTVKPIASQGLLCSVKGWGYINQRFEYLDMFHSNATEMKEQGMNRKKNVRRRSFLKNYSTLTELSWNIAGERWIDDVAGGWRTGWRTSQRQR